MTLLLLLLLLYKTYNNPEPNEIIPWLQTLYKLECHIIRNLKCNSLTPTMAADKFHCKISFETFCIWVETKSSTSFLSLAGPVAARSKAYVYGRSPAGIVGSNPTGGMDVCLLWRLCVCQVEVSVTSWPLVQGSPIDCGASLCATSKPHERGVRIKQAEPLGDACSKQTS